MPRGGDNSSERLYFPGLNAVRFFAAVSVVIQHAESHLPQFCTGCAGVCGGAFLRGHHAVALFFVLSGFLITYLILAERGASGTIHVRRFYLRRALRIWPLYYLIVLLGFVVLPLALPAEAFKAGYEPGNLQHLLLFLCIVPNVALFVPPAVAGVAHLWSVGVEEQFYLVWPVFLKWVGRHVLPALVILIVGKLALQAVIQSLLPAPLPAELRPWKTAFVFLTKFQIEYLALGGVGACLVYQGWRRVLRLVYHPLTQIVTAALFVGVIVWPGRFYEPTRMAVAGVFLLVILNVACNPRPLLRLENRFFNFGGRLSYGIYMFHPALMVCLCWAGRRLGLLPSDTAGVLPVLLFDLAVVGATLLTSWLSYRFFETKFLRLKDRFSVIHTGEAVAALPKLRGRELERVAA